MFFSLIFGYLIGSIPTAYIFARVAKGIDIREHGSGNIGATNTFRVLGKVPGTIVLIIDIFKGVVATTVVPNVFNQTTVLAFILSGVCAVAGHNWTVFLKFKGGKGIATTLGVLIGLTIQIPSIRPVLFLVILIWLVTFLCFGYVSLASMIAAVFLPILMGVTVQPIEVIILAVVFCVFIVVRHHPNIKRLMAGQESRVNLPYFKK